MSTIDPSVFIAENATVVGDVSIGREVSIWYQAVVRGDITPITIGDQSNIQDHAMLHVDFDRPCIVGNRVTVGHRALLHGCVIEDECLIGMGAILLNGVHVGASSLIGAGALLLEGMEVPPGSVVVGSPAKVLREVDDETREQIALGWRHYVEKAAEHRSGRVARHMATRPRQ